MSTPQIDEFGLLPFGTIRRSTILRIPDPTLIAEREAHMFALRELAMALGVVSDRGLTRTAPAGDPE